MTKLLDTSDELLIAPHNGGIKLIRPSKVTPTHLMSVKDLIALPMNIFFLNNNSEIQKLNEHTIVNCGYPEFNKVIGKSPEDLIERATANKLVLDNEHVIKAQKFKITEEEFYLDNTVNSFIALKLPWFDQEDKIIGLVGICPMLGHSSMKFAEALTFLFESGFITKKTTIKPYYLNGIDGVYFTNQELNCLKLLAKGMTMKMIGERLKISPRTVEQYVESIKLKLKVKYKSDLITKINDYSFDDS